jgi:hypothetical protein
MQAQMPSTYEGDDLILRVKVKYNEKFQPFNCSLSAHLILKGTYEDIQTFRRSIWPWS